jgi:hypothetical protein
MANRSRLLVILGTVVLVLSACGPTPSPTASVGASPSASVGVPSAESSTPPASEGALPSVPEIDLDAAAQALADVDSYRLQVQIEGRGAATVAATVVREPELAQDIEITNSQGTQHIILIGDQAWVDATGTGTFLPVPASAVQALTSAFDPVLLAGGFSQPGVLSGLETVGAEDKNGVPTTHYHLDGSSPMGQAASIPPDGVFDVWVAQEGYLVSLTATGVDPNTPRVQMDVTNINDPANVVEAPTT